MTACGMIERDMTRLALTALVAALLGTMAAALVIRARRRRRELDVGAVSAQWLIQHRAGSTAGS
jgi:hypothetical protein